MKLCVTTLSYRANVKEDIGQQVKYDIRAHAPSESRMAIHQWPADEKKYKEAFPRIVEKAENLLGNNIRPTVSNMRVSGVKFLRLYCGEGKFFAECVI